MPKFLCHCIYTGSGELRHRCDAHRDRALLTAVLLAPHKERASDRVIRDAEELATRILERPR